MYIGALPPPLASASASQPTSGLAAFDLGTARSTIHSCARVLFSFESLLVVSALAFLFLGFAFFLLLWSLIGDSEDEADGIQHTNQAQYAEAYTYTQDSKGRWVAVPVLLMPHHGHGHRRAHAHAPRWQYDDNKHHKR
ncbi:hypothetical protein HMN09_00558800 [Mycena chlorophos]|uniref:Uncharacterized protein n=1 Tax=Mycena chlorophos TaxID=658473 RepID=A0A8H6TAB0_MYCCL|nr:hypothetical protein HMN09_00558800 [Mycena chlorophos]